MVLALCVAGCLSGCIASSKETIAPSARVPQVIVTQKALGAIEPTKALEYMLANKELVIIDVATRSHYNRIHFQGAINIPIEEISREEEAKLFQDIPAEKPVLLHCRRGMVVGGAYARLLELRKDIPEVSYIAGVPLFEEYNLKINSQQQVPATKLLGGQAPNIALEYMKNTKNLIIIEVNNPEWKLKSGITGAIWIPYTQMAERYSEIPAGKPVLLYCGGGIVSVDAYKTLQEKRPDIPELSYIAGPPPVTSYNEWVQLNNS